MQTNALPHRVIFAGEESCELRPGVRSLLLAARVVTDAGVDSADHVSRALAGGLVRQRDLRHPHQAQCLVHIRLQQHVSMKRALHAASFALRLAQAPQQLAVPRLWKLQPSSKSGNRYAG